LLKRRDSGDSNAENSTEKAQPKYSVSVYIIILFAVVMLVILLSYLVQQRNSDQTIDNLSEQHGIFASQALENIENLQNKNIELIDAVAEKDKRIEELEDEIEKLRQSWADDVKNVEDTMKSDYNELSQEYHAVKAVLDAKIALESGNETTAREKLELAEAVKDRLDEPYLAELERLKSQLS